MTSEMGEIFNALRRERQEKRAERRVNFSSGPEWTRHHETHYSRDLLGERLDYWPGPMKWRWRGKTATGDVMQFIAAQERRHQVVG